MEDYKPRVIPSKFNSYWAAFITLGCNLNCEYCIQRIDEVGARKALNYKIVPGRMWVRALNLIQWRTKRRFLRRAKRKKLAIIGGEPTIHPDFMEIVNGLDRNWSITVTTNLATPIFSDIKKFLRNLRPKARLKFHASLHFQYADAKLFIERVLELKRGGLNVKRLFIVAHPEIIDQIPEYEKRFKEKGLFLEVQRFTGFYKGKLYPLGEEGQLKYHFDDGITDYSKYEEGFSLKSEKPILCRLNRVLFAPDGDIYNCHYKLYTKSEECYGNLFDHNFKTDIPTDFFLCRHYGYCNPCEYPHVEFKSLSEIPNIEYGRICKL